MIECAHRHVLGRVLAGELYSDESLVTNAAQDSRTFENAAVRATDQGFVDRVGPKIREKTRSDFLGRLKNNPDAKEVLGWIEQQDQQCAEMLKQSSFAPTSLPATALPEPPLAFKAHQIKVGASRKDVIEALGEPDTAVRSKDGKGETLIYQAKVKDVPKDAFGNRPAGEIRGDNCIVDLTDDAFVRATCLSDIFR